MNAGESWSWDPAPGYISELHRQLPFDLACVPINRMVLVEDGRIVQDRAVAFAVGRNREVIQSHAAWVQSVVDIAAQTVAGFHRNFIMEPHKIPDFPSIPPPGNQPFESLAWPTTIELAPLTKSGKVPKFPLKASVIIFSDVLVSSGGFFIRRMDSSRSEQDETVLHFGYLANGTLGKASVHCWRAGTRWSVDCVTSDGQIVIARIERGDALGNTTRFYDYKTS